MRIYAVFADVCNYFLKEKLVRPQDLRPYDTTEIFIPEILADKADTAQKYRDVIKECAVAMEDNQVAYVLFGIENQTEIDYSMVARNYIYDAMRYSKQLRDIAREHRKNSVRASDGFLSQFYPADRLKPVVTLVVYYGAKPWDGAVTLYELFPSGCERLYPLIDNYSLKVMDASRLSDQELEGFESSLREVMMYIKYSQDKDKLQKSLEENENFQHMPRDAAQVISAVTGMDFVVDEEEETFNMCKAVYDIRQEGKSEGRAEGRVEGRVEGRAEGIESVARRMIHSGESNQSIIKFTLLPEERIEQLREEELKKY